MMGGGDPNEMASLQVAIEQQNDMLKRMIEKVNEDREKRVRDKNAALMKKIKRLERKKRVLATGGDANDSMDLSDEEEAYPDIDQ